jgi:DNA-binding transcriptional regulator YiaG
MTVESDVGMPVQSKTRRGKLGLDAIRDSRIASQDGFRDTPDHIRHQKFAAGAFPRRLRAWRERNNLSQSEAALKLQISKRTLQEWEQGRAAPRGFARTAIEKAIRA